MDYSVYPAEEALPAFDTHLSAEEKTLLSDLLVESSRIQPWAVAKIKEYTNRIRSLKSVYNAGAPISRKLPREVLAEIFVNLYHREYSWDVEIKYLHVCRLWRHLILRTPAFWVNMLSRHRSMHIPHSHQEPRGLRHFELFLRLSRAKNLTLSLETIPPVLLRTLQPHISRISSLSVALAEYSDLVSLNHLIQGGMPVLEHLGVTHSPYFPETIPDLAISRETHPRLRSLALPFEALGLACLDNDLRSLEVSQCRCIQCRHIVEQGNQPTLSKVLELCPSLRRLKIKNILHLWGPLDRTVALPALSELIIEEHRGDLGSFLAHMTYPRTCAVHLGTSAHTTLRACLPPNPDSWPQITEVDEVRFSSDFDGWSVLTASARGDKRLRVGMHAKTTQLGAVAELSQLFTPATRVTSLTIDPRDYPFMRKSDDPGTVFCDILAAFPHLTHLDIGGYDGRRVMPLLTETSAEGLRYCPSLKELQFVWYYGDDELYKPPETRDAWTPGIILDKWYKAGSVVFSMFCDITARMLDQRRAAGKPMERLSIGVYSEVVTEHLYKDKEGWEPSVLKERLRKRLAGYEDHIDVFHVKVDLY
ncbi:hypothetical protein L226DRAFT_614125 [Lentinus tigrinus ALCF2SS1-7]|uniref:F-box domain-containing protein n=1 Tax=Lentinus tigrinus ALCF2SS1-6 TaxID=1328759 RepID=A0A5C2S6D3_9APHY|nr:hypothetical protein L227DRAFT_654292 [Lentinus tigrinus ALCF2SS1-6]RPD73629.1 hypothetical protein L226DRAFT_614125 [Lentinus tigrinus ALCF2SS1-7]